MQWICDTKDEWLATLSTKNHPNTIKSHAHLIKLFCSWVIQQPNETLDLSLLKAFVSYLQNERRIGYETLRGYIGILVRWLMWISTSDYKCYISDDQLFKPNGVRAILYSLMNTPEPRVDRPIPDLRRLPAYYEVDRQQFRGKDGVQQLIVDAKHRRVYLTTLRNRALLAALFSSGARLSKVLALRSDQLDTPDLRLNNLAYQWIREYLTARQPWYPTIQPIFISHGPRGEGEILSADAAERAVKIAAFWLADRRADEGADPEEVAQLRLVSAETIRRFLAQERQTAADYFAPDVDLRDVEPNH